MGHGCDMGVRHSYGGDDSYGKNGHEAVKGKHMKGMVHEGPEKMHGDGKNGYHGMKPVSDAAHEKMETPAEERKEHRTGKEAKHMFGAKRPKTHGTVY